MDTLSTSQIIAASTIILIIGFLGYLGIKTLMISNWFKKAVYLYQNKDYEAAETEFRKIMKIAQSNDVVRLMLGDLLNRQGRLREAREMFTEVINRSPKNPDAYLRLANILMLENQKQAAITNLEKSLELFEKQRQPQQAQKVRQILQEITNKG